MKKIFSIALAFSIFAQPLSVLATDDNSVVRERPEIFGALNKKIYEGYSIDLLQGVYATDKQDGNLTHYINVNPKTIDTSVPGKHIVTYSVEDTDGNVETLSIQIEVLPRIDTEAVSIPDKNLRARINLALKQGSNDIITIKQLETIEKLDLANRKITNLDGIQYCTNIKELDISNNEIKNIDYLENLGKLEVLNASNNKIEDISAVSSLIYLKTLDLSNNQIKDARPILTFQGEKLRLHNQIIYLDEVRDNKNDMVTITNPIKDEKGNPVEPFNVEEYNKDNNKITWSNITTDTTKTFNFTKAIKLGKSNTVFKGEVILPIKNVYSQSKDGVSDIPNNHWAKDVIFSFIDNGYIGGYEDGTFRPENKITRAEFIKVFNRYFGLKRKSGVVFSDTKDHWSKEEVDIAVTNGVVNGITKDKFAPNDYITREQAASMISNYKQIASHNYEMINKYKDSKDVSTWAKSSLEAVLKRGYMRGYSDNTLKPKSYMTRAEVVSMLNRIK